MLFTNKTLHHILPLFINDDIIDKSNQHSFLGIIFDETLTFKYHISNILPKLSRIVSLVFQLKDLMPTYALKILYDVHALSHLHYCTPL